MAAATILMTFRRLAEIAEKNPGYSVLVLSEGMACELTNIRFARTATGRRNKATVEATYAANGQRGVWNSDGRVEVLD